MPFAFSLSAIIPATPQEIYDAWLDSGAHGKMTGGKARISAKKGAAFTAWDDYISGKNLALEPGRRIVQSWRTAEFTAQEPDSEIEVLLEPVAGGTKLTLRHSNVPDGQTSYRDGGWQEYYFAPMKRHFVGGAPKPAAGKKRRSPRL